MAGNLAGEPARLRRGLELMDSGLPVELAEQDSEVVFVIMPQNEGGSRGYYEDYI